MVKAGQEEATIGRRGHRDQGCIVAQSDLVILPAELGIGIGRARVADLSVRQIQIEEQGLLLLQQQLNLLVDERLLYSMQDLGDGLLRLSTAGSQRSTDATVVGQRVQTPGTDGWPIVGQRMRPVVEILQMSDAGQDAHQEGQHLALRRMHHAFLRKRHTQELGNQTDFVGKLAPGNHQGMLRQHALG